MATETDSSLAPGADSEIDVITSDTGANVVEGAAAETPTLEPEHDQQRESQTPVLPIETLTNKKPESREKKADNKKSGKKPSKRQRMSSGEKDSVTPTTDSGLTGPISTQVLGIVVVDTESPPAKLSRRNTPIRQSAQAARLLLSTSRLTKKEEETRKEEENTEANFSTTVSSLSESEEGHNSQQLLKREKLKKQKPHKGRISAFISATLVASTSKSKL